MDGKGHKLPIEELSFSVKFTVNTGIHRRLVTLAKVSEMSPADFIKSQIERAWGEYVEWKVCNGSK